MMEAASFSNNGNAGSACFEAGSHSGFVRGRGPGVNL